MSDVKQVGIVKGGKQRAQYVLKLWKLNILIFLALIQSFLIVYFILKKPDHSYYATTTVGKVQRIYALSEPIVTNTYLLKWAESVGRQLFSLSFASFNDDINKVAPYFSLSGFSAYQAALQSSGFKKSILGSKVNISSIVSENPYILDQGVSYGRYRWVINLPMMMSLESASLTTKQKYNIELTVERVPVLDAPLGGIQVSDIQVNSAS